MVNSEAFGVEVTNLPYVVGVWVLKRRTRVLQHLRNECEKVTRRIWHLEACLLPYQSKFEYAIETEPEIPLSGPCTTSAGAECMCPSSILQMGK
jgi:hypothetical protein